jgi:hypothetical protein
MNIAVNSMRMTSEDVLMPPLARLEPMLRLFCAIHTSRSPKLRESCRLDVRIALSGRRFGVDGNTALQILPRRSQLE